MRASAEQIIAEVAQSIRGNIIDTLYEAFDVGLSDVSAAQWKELGFKDDHAFFLAEKETARAVLVDMVGPDHTLVCDFDGTTWAMIVAYYYADA